MEINFLTPSFATSNISSRLRLILTYVLVLLFIGLTYTASLSVRNFVNSTLSITLIEPAITPFIEDQPQEESKTIYVNKGENLKNILQQQKISSQDINDILNLEEVRNISTALKVNQKIIFDYDFKTVEDDNNELEDSIRTLQKINIEIDKANLLQITKNEGKFTARHTTLALNKLIKRSHLIINANFIQSLKSLGLPLSSINEVINAYSHQVDFQRQIKPNDTITIITEKFTTENGKFSHHGKILYASLNLSGKHYNIYRYSHDNSKNNHKFFSEDGKSVQGNLLRTPLKLIRVSSNFGTRKHPISGYTKMHTGVDFAAPIGTPIYAAGAGVVTEMGRKGGYGNFLQIKHSPTLSTAYGHISKFNKNLKVGSKIMQGDIVAYVGNTGGSTGPHLHYEVKIDGRHVNPMGIKTTPEIVLAKKELVAFQKFKDDLKKLDTKLIDIVEVAEADIEIK